MNIFTEHPKPKIKIGILFLKRKRAGFVPEWGEYIEEKVHKQLQSSIFTTFIPEVKIVDVITLRSALEECKSNSCQVLIAIQPTVSDGRMSPVFSQYSQMPVVFWATPEKQEGSMISACSLVGAHTFAANLAQSGRKFEFVYGMPDEPMTKKDFNEAVYRAYAYSVLSGSSAGLIGYHAPGFIDMHVDPQSLRENLNVELFHFGLNEFTDKIKECSNDEVEDDVKKIKQLGFKLADEINDDDLRLASQYYLVMKNMMDSMPLNAMAVRDWPELSATHWPYLAMARLASEGYAIACEGDVDGALSCLMGYASGCGACYLSDWLEHDEHHITLWHGGAAPFQLCEDSDSHIPPEIATHFNNRKPAVVNATLKSDNMPITLFRLWHLNGKYLFTAIEGKTVKPKRHLWGTNGVGLFESTDIKKYFNLLIRKGFPHHPVIVQGHQKHHLYLLADMFNIECIQ